jgi:hypothetical protein
MVQQDALLMLEHKDCCASCFVMTPEELSITAVVHAGGAAGRAVDAGAQGVQRAGAAGGCMTSWVSAPIRQARGFGHARCPGIPWKRLSFLSSQLHTAWMHHLHSVPLR